MNNKGFTLVEIISVIALLALVMIITVPAISKTSLNIKKKTLNTKVENIEKAAILYGQKYRENFTVENKSCKYCEDKKTPLASCNSANIENGKCYLSNCKCYLEKDQYNSIVNIDVSKLISENLIKEDKITESNEKVITNPVDESKNLNNCKIQIYQKYGKIYAVYESKDTSDTTCWYE